MKRMVVPLVATVLAAALVIEWTHLVPACGPFFFPTVFTETTQPDSPLGPYTRGRLGVLQPGYERIYLYAAYRNLMGRRFDRAQALALWGIPAESAELLDEVPKATPESSPPPPPLPQPVDWPHAWIDARNHVANVPHAAYLAAFPFPAGVQIGDTPTPDGIYRSVNGPNGRYLSYLNCLPTAFEAATNTLRDRTQRYGDGNPALLAWVAAQDGVFSNCLQGDTIPDPLPADAATLARADRNYQIAAAYFYAGDFPHAESAFTAIANDQASPWSPVAQYLTARAYIRQATVGHDDSAPDMAALASAERQLKQVLNNPKASDLHASAEALREYVEVRLHPEQRTRELAEALMQNPAPAELSRDIHDYTFLLDKLENEQYANFTPAELQSNREAIYLKLAELRARDDLTDWILTFQLNNAAALDHAYEKWQQTNSPAWLAAAITKVEPGDPRAPKLMAAAATVPASAPAYDSVTFHRFRLMMQNGDRAAVLPQLNRMLAHDTAGMPRSALNLFLAIRMTYARNLADFLKYAARVPVELNYNGYGSCASSHPAPGGPWFDSDALTVLNQQMTPATLTEAAGSKVLPVYLGREVARGAWTRAFLLGQDQAALRLAPVLAALQPELRPSLDRFTNAATPDARRFAGALLILRFPGLRPYITSPEREAPTHCIDNLRQNWWGIGLYCVWPASQFDSAVLQQPGAKPNIVPWPVLESPLTELYPAGSVPRPSFLSRAEVDAAQRDWNRTRALPVASIMLGKEVLAWVQTHPDDSRAPEALSLTVRAGHFGCADPNRWKVSEAAFGLLHRRYPESRWAKQTKYWYR